MMNNLTKVWLSTGIIIWLCAACEQIKDKRLKNGLIYCSEGNPESFNPQTTTSRITLDASAHQLYDRLIEKSDSSDQLVASLAESWDISDDGKTIDMYLRKGVKFHKTRYFIPSREFNAEDVIFTFNRWRLNTHPFYASADSYPHMQSYQLELLIDDIQQVSSHHVRFKLSSENHDFLTQLTTDYMVILSAEYGAKLALQEAQSQLDNYPIGTGPFYLEDFVKDEYIRYKAHENYWQGKTKIDQLVFDITPQSSNRLAKLITGECDVVAHPVASEMEVLQDRPGISLQSKNADNIAFWAFNTLKPPFNRSEIRRALAKAIDRQTIYKTIYYGMAFPANSLLPPSSWAYNNNLPTITYNPEQAKKELQAAGIEPGFKMQIWSAQIEREYNPNSLKMAELIKANLAKVGIVVEIVEFEWSTLRKKLLDYSYDSVLLGWTPDMQGPDNYFIPTLSCPAAVIGNNRAAWCNPYFDNLLHNAAASTDLKQQKDHYMQAQSLLLQEMPVVPIAHSLSFLAKQHNVVKVKFQPFSAISFKHAEKF
ncbi:extracellular solute-binding protein [Catenovulum agarivorans DS-2]|uniref:Extracellular solute-binding protein n=1 Tax=Catenovulum agarivorans DS-2 TaxID=1328313 RepID=W7QVV5_9ALTE|nr:ABC transporter substrate-binding protein [Catenovulum agarivorans]EWH11853.1 extracellular solute-binding protein [Catenovulum agarivorans DS-2]